MAADPAPLVDPAVDLRDFGYVPLDVVRLRDSDIAALASGDEFKAAVLLWCAAWHQVPAASVPDDDRWLARHSGAGPKWRKVKGMAMRGFVKCSDGRLYHVTLAEKATEAWAAKSVQRARTSAATAARLAKHGGSRNVERNESRNEHRNETSTDNVTSDVTKSYTQRNVHQGKGRDLLSINGSGLSTVEATDPTDTPKTAGDRSPESQKPGAGAQWWTSEAGIDAKGRELGVNPKLGEEYPAFKTRLFEVMRDNLAGKLKSNA